VVCVVGCVVALRIVDRVGARMGGVRNGGGTDAAGNGRQGDLLAFADAIAMRCVRPTGSISRCTVFSGPFNAA
jgi:hypothetical protein